jgi:hypothetical protein
LFQTGKIGRIVFLHQAIAVGAAEIEDVVGILFEEGEIIVEGVAKEFVDDLGVFPSPLGIEVRVADNVQGRLAGQVWRDGLDRGGGGGGKRRV